MQRKKDQEETKNIVSERKKIKGELELTDNVMLTLTFTVAYQQPPLQSIRIFLWLLHMI